LTEGTPRATVAKPRVVVGGPTVGAQTRFDEAIRAWRRAVQTTDAIAAATAIWEAIEFYAARTRPPAIFDKKTRRRLESAIEALGLGEAQSRRFAEVAAYLNDPPLMAKLEATLKTDAVPHTVDEIAALGRIRKARNDFVHGRSRRQPSRGDLDLGKGIVNRMLVFWARSGRGINS
jgi:hypothetical protein